MINPDDYDAFYFSRSDLSDELKLEIMRAKIEKARGEFSRGEGLSIEQVREELKGWHQEALKNYRYKNAG